MTKEEALRQMAAYCAGAERCKSDIAEKLKKKEIDVETIENIIAYLEKEKYLNEERFCRAFVNDKFRFAKWGKLKIRQALNLKRIPSDMVYDALDSIDEEAIIIFLKLIVTSYLL